MAVETPADIFILGLNRLSVEAGLYGRYLGYNVTLLGQQLFVDLTGEVETEIQLTRSTSPLGRMALEAHNVHLSTNEILDLKSLHSNYVSPLADSDLLSESSLTNCQQISVAMGETDLPEKIDDDVEYDLRVFELRIRVENEDTEIQTTADVLVDCRHPQELDSTLVDFDFELPPKASIDGYSADPAEMITNTDDFYFLGQARDPACNFGQGLAEIQLLFKILCDNTDLDLYKK